MKDKKPQETVRITVLTNGKCQPTGFIYQDWLGRTLELTPKQWQSFPLSSILEGLKVTRLKRAPNGSTEGQVRVPTVVYALKRVDKTS